MFRKHFWMIPEDIHMGYHSSVDSYIYFVKNIIFVDLKYGVEVDSLWSNVEIYNVNRSKQWYRIKENDKIYYLANGKDIDSITVDEWDVRCRNYFDRNIRDMKKNIFPNCINPNSKEEMIAKSLFESLDWKGDDVWLFTHYNLVNHVNLFLGSGDIIDTLLEELSIFNIQDLEPCHNRMIFIHNELNHVVNLRLTLSNKLSSIYKEEENLQSDLKLLQFLNRRHFKQDSPAFTNVIVAPNINLDSDLHSPPALCWIIGPEILHNRVKTDNWLNTNIFNHQRKTHSENSAMCMVKELFKFETVIQRYNPRASDKKLRSTNLFLTAEQHEIILDPALKKIIAGAHGTGKTLCGKIHYSVIVSG